MLLLQSRLRRAFRGGYVPCSRGPSRSSPGLGDSNFQVENLCAVRMNVDGGASAPNSGFCSVNVLNISEGRIDVEKESCQEAKQTYFCSLISSVA